MKLVVVQLKGLDLLANCLIRILVLFVKNAVVLFMRFHNECRHNVKNMAPDLQDITFAR